MVSEDGDALFFFFQAEDGIRDVAVTGVQTCALPIYFLAAAAIGLVQAADADEALRIAASINSDHASLLLADFDLLTIPQILRTLDDHRIAGSDAREHGDLGAAVYPQADGAALELAVTQQIHERSAGVGSHGALGN